MVRKVKWWQKVKWKEGKERKKINRISRAQVELKMLELWSLCQIIIYTFKSGRTFFFKKITYASMLLITQNQSCLMFPMRYTIALTWIWFISSLYSVTRICQESPNNEYIKKYKNNQPIFNYLIPFLPKKSVCPSRYFTGKNFMAKSMIIRTSLEDSFSMIAIFPLSCLTARRRCFLYSNINFSEPENLWQSHLSSTAAKVSFMSASVFNIWWQPTQIRSCFLQVQLEDSSSFLNR